MADPTSHGQPDVGERVIAGTGSGADRPTPPVVPAPPPTLLLAAADTAGLTAQLDHWIAARGPADDALPSIGEAPPGGPARLAVVDVTPRRLELARTVLAQGKPWRGRTGVWFEPHGLLASGGRLAFVFPGVEPTFEPRIDDLARRFAPEAAGAAGLPAAPDGPRTPELERRSRAIVAVGRFLHRVLTRIGVTPDMVAGHSIGEWCGSIAAGIVAEEAVDELVARLQPGAVEVPDVVYLALGCGVAVAGEVIAGLDRTAVSHDNCPQQSVVCGPPDQIAVAAERARGRGVLAQELPFRSGFHSPLFTAYTPVLREAFGSLPLRPARVPLWSATTCRPYPNDPAGILEVAERHLLEPVRFRELALALHDAGARVFVQVGVGNLAGFVADTLRGRPAVAVPANTPKRSGLEQLLHVAAALWVEGHGVDMSALLPSPTRISPPKLALQHEERGQVRSTNPETKVWRERFALDVEPAWADHALFRQVEGWPHPQDRFPLVPMTGIIEILMASAARLHPGLVPVRVEDVAAFRYLVVDPPAETTIRASTLGTGSRGPVRVKVEIERYAQGTVVLAPRYPTAPPARPPELTNPRASHITADRLYADRHMFHGPAYQGVEDLLALADDGSRALIRTPTGPGALLDNAGQLMGHWLSGHAEDRRLILPTSIQRVELFGPHPPPGALVDCTVVVDRFDDRVLRADIVLLVGDGTDRSDRTDPTDRADRLDRFDRLWCRITAWEDRRYAVDALTFEMLKWPERNVIADDAVSGGRTAYAQVRDRWADPATRELIMRRYLGHDEQASYHRQPPRAQRPFLLGRIAAKDAVRRWLWDHGHGPLFPAEVLVAEDAAGRTLVRGPYVHDLRISLDTTDNLAVAVVTEGERIDAPAVPVGAGEPGKEHAVA
jgi:malonyl CoA-acyl carrier protein transacylase